jgi:hypothetical protein
MYVQGMALPALDRAAKVAELRALLQEKHGPAQVLDAPSSGVLPSGIRDLDALLPGGLPRGALTLFTGRSSSGKTGAALSYLAGFTQDGGAAAWLHAGGFSPGSAAWAGADLRRVLQVRSRSRQQAFRCADSLLRWQAFGLVVVDWVGSAGRGASWSRLHRLVTGSRTALLVLAWPLPEADPLLYAASAHLEFARRPGRGGGGAGVVEAELRRSRFTRPGGRARLLHGGMDGAPFALHPDLPGLGQGWHDEVG